MLCEPRSAQDSQRCNRHGPGSCHVQTVRVDQEQWYPLLEDVSQPNLPCLQMAQESCCRMSMSDGYNSLTADSHAQRGEGGWDGFFQWWPVDTTEPLAPPSCLCKDTYPDILCSFPNPNACPTTKHLGPTPWILDSGEKQLDLHTTVTIPRNPSFSLKMLVDSGSSGSLIDKHLVLQLFSPLNYYDTSFTHHSDSIALDSSYMTHLLRFQSAWLRTFSL